MSAPLYETIWTSDIAPHAEEPMDVWLRIPEGGEESEAEANTYAAHDGTYVVEWYLTSVGLVTGVGFPTYEEARAWLESNDFEDFTS